MQENIADMEGVIRRKADKTMENKRTRGQKDKQWPTKHHTGNNRLTLEKTEGRSRMNTPDTESIIHTKRCTKTNKKKLDRKLKWYATTDITNNLGVKPGFSRKVMNSWFAKNARPVTKCKP